MSTHLYKKYRVLWLQSNEGGHFVAPARITCCDDLRDATTFDCDQHADPFECADCLLIYNDVTDEYGLPIRDGGASVLLITHCPFCGAALPDSKADRWFDEIEALGLTPGDETMPAKFKSDAWWRNAET